MHQYKLWWDPLYSYWLKSYNQSNQFCFSFFVPIDFALSLYEGLKEAFHVKKKEQKRSLLAFINVLNYLMFQYNPFLRRHLERNVQSYSTKHICIFLAYVPECAFINGTARPSRHLSTSATNTPLLMKQTRITEQPTCALPLWKTQCEQCFLTEEQQSPPHANPNFLHLQI